MASAITSVTLRGRSGGKEPQGKSQKKLDRQQGMKNTHKICHTARQCVLKAKQM